MMQYSLQPKDIILVKVYRFFSFTKKIKQKIQSMYISYVSKSSSSC